MTQLANLQSLFQNHVVIGDDAAAASFVGDPVASAEERLGVYYEAYRLRLVEILRIDFPGLCGLMGGEPFDATGLRYLDKHPSQYPSVRQFGRQLAEFLATDSNTAEQPWLAEMARFEWARGLAFDAAEAEVTTIGELGGLPADAWPALKLRFHPTLQRIRCDWNIVPIWRAINVDEAMPKPARLEQPQPWAVWRRDITVYWRSLDKVESSAMDLFSDGRDFAEVCSVLCEQLDAEAVPATMAGILKQWVMEGLVQK